MAIYRFVMVIGLVILIRKCCSAPTLSATSRTDVWSTTSKLRTSPTDKSSISSTAPPTVVMEKTTEETTTEKSSTEEKMVVKNKTDESLGNVTVTSSSNGTNETEVVEEDGPSSILYPVCSSYIGIHNQKIIKNEQMSASSTLDINDLMKLINATLEALENNSTENSTEVKSNFTITGNMTAAHDGRLGNTEGSWCASGDPGDGEHHLIVDLGQVVILEGVITQGRSDSDNWVTEYTVSHSSDNRHWMQVKKEDKILVFKGNKDRNSMAVGSFPHRIAARYIKFTPKAFHGKLMCMRVEAVGCHPDAVNVAKNQPTKQSSSERNMTSHKVVDGKFVSRFHNETCIRTQTQLSPWLRIDLRRTYHVKEIFLSNQDHKQGLDMWDLEVRVGKSLDNEGNDNPLCSPLYDVLPGHIRAVVCKNATVGRYVNIRVPREDSKLSLCEVAVVGVAETVVKLGLEDIASSLQTGSGKAGETGDFVGGLLGQLQGQLQGQLGGMLGAQGMGMLNNLKGQGMGMLNNLKGQGMGMLNNLQGQGMGMLNNLKGQGLEMANKLKNKGMEMANKMKEQGLEMANKMNREILSSVYIKIKC